MTKWVLSDGTVVHLGGNVEGQSMLARELIRDVRAARGGNRPAVMALPPGGGLQPLDLDDTWHVHIWIHEHMHRHGVTLTEAPQVSAPAEWSESDESDSSSMKY